MVRTLNTERLGNELEMIFSTVAQVLASCPQSSADKISPELKWFSQVVDVRPRDSLNGCYRPARDTRCLEGGRKGGIDDFFLLSLLSARCAQMVFASRWKIFSKRHFPTDTRWLDGEIGNGSFWPLLTFDCWTCGQFLTVGEILRGGRGLVARTDFEGRLVDFVGAGGCPSESACINSISNISQLAQKHNQKIHKIITFL